MGFIRSFENKTFVVNLFLTWYLVLGSFSLSIPYVRAEDLFVLLIVGYFLTKMFERFTDWFWEWKQPIRRKKSSKHNTSLKNSYGVGK